MVKHWAKERAQRLENENVLIAMKFQQIDIAFQNKQINIIEHWLLWRALVADGKLIKWKQSNNIVICCLNISDNESSIVWYYGLSALY